MAANHDDPSEKDAKPAAPSGEPGSDMRVKHKPAEWLQLLIINFKARAEGKTGDALQREVDGLVELIVKRNANALPRALRDQLRSTVRDMLESDPAMQALIGDLRASVNRG